MAKDEPLKPDTEQQGRQVPLALDLLEPGSDDLQVERVSQKLPKASLPRCSTPMWCA